MQQGHASFFAIAVLMFLTGIGIPLMATLNAGLGRQLESPAAATTILFAIALVLAVVALAIGGLPSPDKFAAVRPMTLFGALFVVAYILSITWAAPKIGIGNAVFFVLLGQLAAAAAVDHFGLWGALKSEITGRRVAGIAVMALGVYLARKPV